MLLPRLPLGISDGVFLREDGADCVAVDKTAAIAHQLDAGTCLLLAVGGFGDKSLDVCWQDLVR